MSAKETNEGVAHHIKITVVQSVYISEFMIGSVSLIFNITWVSPGYTGILVFTIHWVNSDMMYCADNRQYFMGLLRNMSCLKSA